MEVRKRQGFNERTCLLEFLVALAGKSDHNIGTNRGIGHGAAYALDSVCVMPRAILAMHAAQDSVAAGLQWNVRVLGDAWRRRDQFNQFDGPIHRLD